MKTNSDDSIYFGAYSVPDTFSNNQSIEKINEKSVNPLTTEFKDYPNYKLIELLGQGFFGQVWKAVRLSDNKIIALKIITVNNNLEDIYRELEILKRIQKDCKPFLACLNNYEYLESQNKFLIDMELIVGDNLAVFIKKTPINKRIKYLLLILKDLTRTLQHLHQNGILHNDIKPDNILITKNLVPVLVDFGVSCFDTSLCDKYLCCTGVKGPNLFASPETLKSKTYYEQSDV